MKLKLKLVAIAAAMASLSGVAHADLTSGSTVNNGSFSLLAFNTVTRDWYIRDLGYLINDFIPTGITTSAADGAVVGNKTGEAGQLINGSVKSNFSDAAFGTWFAAQTAADVRWMVGAYDQISSSGSGSQRRTIVSSTNAAQTFQNGSLDTFVGTGSYGGLFNFANPLTLSKTGIGMNAAADTGFSSFVTLGLVGGAQNLYYNVRSAFTGSSSNQATITQYGNSVGAASLTLAANGDLTYSLAPANVAAVPLPAAAWLMGAGLLGIGGMVRRRRAAAAAQA
jgi:hypothetical protein